MIIYDIYIGIYSEILEIIYINNRKYIILIILLDIFFLKKWELEEIDNYIMGGSKKI